MNGLELSRAYFEAHGLPMLETQFPHILPFLAAGLFGSGSECFGFDDELSRDHDFDPGFLVLLPGEDVVSRRDAFLLERACAKLPGEFMGLRRGMLAPAGGPRRGVIRTADFFQDKTGSENGILTLGQWLTVPEQSLAEAVNGAVFLDNSGEVTRIRGQLSHYPEDIRRKKLAGRLMLMAQAGQYNYARCLAHGETGAAQLAVVEFVDHAMAAVFLLNDAYRPFYKWSFRALRALPRLSLLAELMEYLLTTDNDAGLSRAKRDVMEGMIRDICAETLRQGMSAADPDSIPEAHARSVNDGIADPGLRNLHILAAVGS